MTMQDNMRHRELFTLPPLRESASTAITVPEVPPQQAVTGDKEIDAVLWLQQVVSTGQPDLIAKAMAARERIKTPMKVLEERYRKFLAAKNPGSLFAVLSSFGFGELESQAKRAVSRNAAAAEAMARFGSETALFNNTPAEEFIVSALDGLEYENKKSGLPELTREVIEAFRMQADRLPHTLSDCLHELAYWSELYRLRNAVCSNGGDGLHEEWVRRDFMFSLMAKIRPRTKGEARAVMSYMIGGEEGDDHLDRDGADAILLNLVEIGDIAEPKPTICRFCASSSTAVDQLEDWQRARLEYTDAELYRLIVARNLLDGYGVSKAELDAKVRQLGDIEEAEKFIAFRARRPGCIAVEFSGIFECACGVSWAADGPEPACKKELL